QEIELLVTQGIFLAQTRGSGVPEVEETLARADSLSRRLGEDLPLQVVNGLMSMHVTRSDRKGVEQLLPQFRRMAEQQEDLLAHTSGHLLLGSRHSGAAPSRAPGSTSHGPTPSPTQRRCAVSCVTTVANRRSTRTPTSC